MYDSHLCEQICELTFVCFSSDVKCGESDIHERQNERKMTTSALHAKVEEACQNYPLFSPCFCKI